MIDNVVAALGLGLNLTDEEIADVLWLAVQMQQFGDGEIPEQGDRNEALKNSVSNRESPKQPAQPLRDDDRDRQDENKQDEQNFEVHSKNAQGDDRSTRRSDELQLKIPDARSLQEPLELARSLRPLMRRVPSQVNTLLDEEATVRRIAEEKIWCPVLRPALEPWLDLALVIDDSASMLMWRHTIAELQHFLSSYGVFRDVRVWRLGTDKAEKVCIYAGATASDRNGSPRSPSELIEANGRGLVLVVSDCIAPIWRNGAIANALQIWSRSGMAAILQMLPDWLWGRTALGRGVAAQFSALAAGIPNYQLTTKTVSTWYDIDLATSIKIPVVTLEPEKFTAWAEMLAGKGGAWSAGIVFEPELFAVPEVAIEFDDATELDAEDRVQSFRLTASPIARRLAGLLAAAPVISLPIVRILQSTVLTESQPVHVAEVFLGGLLKPLSEITAKTNPNYVQYDFIEGVRDQLLESVPSSEIVNIVAEISEFVAERLGISLEEFAAVIRSPQKVKDSNFVHQTRPFAILTAQILKRLGGEYAHFAEEIAHNLTISTVNHHIDNASDTDKVSNVNKKPYDLGNTINTSSMTIEEAISIVDTALQHKHLSNIQEQLFRQTWEGKTYAEIAETCGYDSAYIRDVGYRLWQLLSKAFGERVTKNNLQIVVRRYAYISRPHISDLGKVDKVSYDNAKRYELGNAINTSSMTIESDLGKVDKVSHDNAKRYELGNAINTSSMTIEDAILIVDTALQNKRLSNIQEQLFRQTWEGKTYAEIAKTCGYDSSYIRDVGYRLWQLLTNAFGERVTKHNLQVVVRSHAHISRPHISDLGEVDKVINMNGRRCDWGNAVSTSIFCGRTEELEEVKNWVIIDRCRLVGVFGIGGIGKTAFVTELAEQIQSEFTLIAWKSLRNAPSVETILTELVSFLTNQMIATLPLDFDRLLVMLIQALKQSRCLVVFDNLESILRSGETAGHYIAGYEGYGQLFRQIGEVQHQSCLILTSREKPSDVLPPESSDRMVRSLQLSGLNVEEARQMFREELAIAPETGKLIDFYGGNPLALYVVSRSIYSMFDGNIHEFLEQDTNVFGDVRYLLDQQYSRLSEYEMQVMYWLAIRREPITIDNLRQYIVPIVSKSQILESVISLRWRSLIEENANSFTQQPMVMEYMTNRLIDMAFKSTIEHNPEFLISYALVQHRAEDYIRETQIRHILQPLTNRLVAHYGTVETLHRELHSLLESLGDRQTAIGYAQGNIMNLLRSSQGDLVKDRIT